MNVAGGLLNTFLVDGMSSGIGPRRDHWWSPNCCTSRKTFSRIGSKVVHQGNTHWTGCQQWDHAWLGVRSCLEGVVAEDRVKMGAQVLASETKVQPGAQDYLLGWLGLPRNGLQSATSASSWPCLPLPIICPQPHPPMVAWRNSLHCLSFSLGDAYMLMTPRAGTTDQGWPIPSSGLHLKCLKTVKSQNS